MTAADPGRTAAGGYEVYALRYASRLGNKAREYYGYEKYGEPDVPYTMDYFFWLVRNADRTVLVDCGYHLPRAARSGMSDTHDPLVDPVDLLARLDVAPADVDHVVLSHMHLDHIGNVDRFPNATFSVARAELEFWTGYYGSRELVASIVYPEEVQLVAGLEREGRLSLVEDSAEPFAGIRLTRLGGHTPGQLMVEVEGTANQVVLASDAIHFYEEYERDRPFWLFSDLVDTYRTLALLRELDARPGTSVVPGHDPLVLSRFAAVEAGAIADLNRPVGH